MSADIEAILNEQNFASKIDSFVLDELCRLCGSKNETLLSIFDSTNVFNYSEIINSHLNDLHISENDILPLKMCVHCQAALISWNKFYVKSVIVNKQFGELLEKISAIKSGFEEGIEVIEIYEDDLKNDNYHPIKEGTYEIKIADAVVKEDETYESEKLDTSNEQQEEEMKLSSAESNPASPMVDDDECQEETSAAGNAFSEKNDKKPKTTKKSTVCRICGKLFSSRSNYLHHLRKSHSKVKATGTASATTTTTTGAVTTSTRKRAPSNRPKTAKKASSKEPEMCYMCGKLFRDSASYRNHVRNVHHSNGKKISRLPRMCELCGKICTNGSFSSHMLQHTNPETLTCHLCNRVFSHAHSLKNHMKVSHSSDRPFKCEFCPSSFKRADYLRSHIGYKHDKEKKMDARLIQQEGVTYPCEDCGNVFKTREYLRRHLVKRADGTHQCKSAFTCVKCNATFKRRNYLILHERYVHDKGQPYQISVDSLGPYKCDKCDRRFASVSGRNYHCEKFHGRGYHSQFNEKCDHCGLTFRNRVFYARHRAKLCGKPTCYLCWNNFQTEDELSNHIDAEHVNDLPFVCEICRSRFVTLRQLNSHLNTKHLDEKPFKCDICSHKTARKDSLEIHIRSCHLGQKPYACVYCGKCFSQFTDVRKHELIHTRNK